MVHGTLSGGCSSGKSGGALAVCALVLLAAVLGGPCGAQAQSPLWGEQELAARPEENRPGRIVPADHTGPEPARPKAVLPALPEALRGSIRRVDTHGVKLVALTFDLCQLADQRSGYDGRIVDVLRREEAAATFFASGSWLRSHPERAMQLLSDPRFEIGNHAWTHGNFGVLAPGRMREQIEWTQAQYETTREALAGLASRKGMEHMLERVPQSIRAFRFPYGRCRPEALDMLASFGLAAVQWDVNMMDAGKTRTAEAMARDVERSVKPGSIVLGHANGFGRETARALERIIPALRARGYRFVTVSGLLASGRPETSPECFDSRKGDTAVYDSIFGEGVTHPARKR